MDTNVLRKTLTECVLDGGRSALRTVVSVSKSVRVLFSYLMGKGELNKEVTEAYPDPTSSRTQDEMPARFRGILFNDINKCTGCGDCVTACPTACIKLDVEPGPSLGKKWVSVFRIDLRSCIFCGFCVDVCKPQSLQHTKNFEGASAYSNDLLLNFGRGIVSQEQKRRWNLLKDEKSL